MSPLDDDVRYAAPEVLHALQQNQRVAAHPAQDIWTLGVLAYELVTGTRAFAGVPPDAIYKCANAVTPYPWSAHPPHPNLLASEARAIIEGCLRRDPMSRASAQQIFNKLQRLGGFSTIQKAGPWHVGGNSGRESGNGNGNGNGHAGGQRA